MGIGQSFSNVVWLAATVLVAGSTASGVAQSTASGTTRTYYVAADELDWNYAPRGVDGMMDMPPTGYAKLIMERGPHSLGSVYRKALYREYTDATFTHLKPRPASEAYLGTIGPVLHAEVGDEIVVVFKNHGSHPYSMHPHGVFYDKASEGVRYAGGGPVAPGHTHTYHWKVPERAGPGPSDASSIVWLYHSHIDERRDVNSGLIGAIVVTRKGMARPDGTPKDVDREVVQLYEIYDENESWFINDNLRRFAKNVKKARTDGAPIDPTNGNFDGLLGVGVANYNFRDSINGYQFANGPMPRLRIGEHVRWYVATLGEGFNFHTPHWHGNTVLNNGQRTDVLALSPALMTTVNMVPDDPGIWLVHCHVSDHMEGGMSAKYQVVQ